ncbi:DUF2642 domain-containing protein [Effusibacillus dendaii]|uniref:DUF2642 domain-containing protein n=1 Tax=Effusibacillus dendaii TaxID=2743772 RepID=A0A7I8DH47_9BACL|nr:DUF2642 domain-containing protein [Effusibacillus dendaii]BCJ88329.1 hypothetical protein skT53_33140 [Effusibacillus dendaii]
MDFRFLEKSCGKMIQIERGGPDQLEGKLLEIRPDHLCIETQDGVMYVNSNHIKTISEPILMEITNQGTETEDSKPLVLVEAENFHQLLKNLQHKLVKINQAGPNSLEGVLMSIRDDSVTIVHKMKDYVHYPLFHIKTITWIINSHKQEEKKK